MSIDEEEELKKELEILSIKLDKLLNEMDKKPCPFLISEGVGRGECMLLDDICLALRNPPEIDTEGKRYWVRCPVYINWRKSATLE